MPRRQIHGLSHCLVYCAATFGALKMSDREEGVAFLPQECKDEDGVDAADEGHGKEGCVPAGLKEVASHGQVCTSTGEIYFPISDDAWACNPIERKDSLG